MKKFILILFFILFSLPTQAEIYTPSNVKDIKDMAEEIFAKRNPQKTLFIFPLENFILRPVLPAMQQQDPSYNSLFKKAFSTANSSKSSYIKELSLIDYPNEISDPAVVDLIGYIQDNKSAVIIITPNHTGGINQIDHLDSWTVSYLKKNKIDLAKGIFADKKYIFNKEMKKVDGTYPTFYTGLLSFNKDDKNNSAMQAISLLLVGKLKNVPQVVVAVSASKNYLQALENQLKLLNKNNQFFGVLYHAPEAPVASISPEEYLKFWQSFVKKLNTIKLKDVDLKSENPYEE